MATNENDKFKYGYCPLCAFPVDEEKICTNPKCRRRKLQLKLKKAHEDAERAKKAREQEGKDETHAESENAH